LLVPRQIVRVYTADSALIPVASKLLFVAAFFLASSCWFLDWFGLRCK